MFPENEKLKNYDFQVHSKTKGEWIQVGIWGESKDLLMQEGKDVQST